MSSLSTRCLLGILCGVIVGCGSDNATVSGTVTLDGAPLESGFINFMPTEGDTSPEGGPVTDGKFHVTNIPPGKKTVEIIGVKKANFASSSEEMQRRAAEAAARGDNTGLIDPADVIPPDAEGNRQAVELKAGAQTLDFSIKKPAK